MSEIFQIPLRTYTRRDRLRLFWLSITCQVRRVTTYDEQGKLMVSLVDDKKGCVYILWYRPCAKRSWLWRWIFTTDKMINF